MHHNIKKIFIIFFYAMLTMQVSNGAEKINAAASIRPLHSLLSLLMENIGEANLLLKGKASPHHYQLRPSEIKNIRKQNIIFWIGENVETSLIKPLAQTQNLSNPPILINMVETGKFRLLKTRDNDIDDDDHDAHKSEHDDDDAHDDHDDDDHHGHGVNDSHIWTDPDNAEIMLKIMAKALIAADPANKILYRKNLKNALREMNNLEKQIRAKLKPSRKNNNPILLWHDGTQYFEQAFNIDNVAAIIQPNEDVPPSGKHLRTIINRFDAKSCIITQPQFTDKVPPALKRQNYKIVRNIDPTGNHLPAGKDLYAAFLNHLADKFNACAE